MSITKAPFGMTKEGQPVTRYTMTNRSGASVSILDYGGIVQSILVPDREGRLADVALKDGRVDELTVEMWDAIFQSDMRGTFYTTKCALPYLAQNGGGSIVNIGSMASCAGDLGSTAYACAKAGVDMLTKMVATQYGKTGVRCNCVRPGLIVTPQNDAHVPQALKDIFLSNICVNRYGCPEDIGHLCVYLGSDESTYVSGQIMTVDGGLNSHVPTVAQFRAMGSRTW